MDDVVFYSSVLEYLQWGPFIITDMRTKEQNTKFIILYAYLRLCKHRSTCHI